MTVATKMKFALWHNLTLQLAPIRRTHTKGTTMISLFLFLFLNLQAQAKMNVVATTPDLEALVKEVGGDEITSESITKGTQDPHFIEAKPTLMLKLNRADLLVSNGLSLEEGWLPSLIRGARNPKLNAGTKGHLID